VALTCNDEVQIADWTGAWPCNQWEERWWARGMCYNKGANMTSM